MKGFFKFATGIGLGAAIGAIAYFILTSEDEDGITHDLKTVLNEIVKSGREAAETKRSELESELGIKLD